MFLIFAAVDDGSKQIGLDVQIIATRFPAQQKQGSIRRVSI
jgi:hypothetical protein